MAKNLDVEHLIVVYSPSVPRVDLTLYIQTLFLFYGCDNILRINYRGERYPSAL